MKRILVLLLVLFLGAAACDETTSTIDGGGTGDGTGTGGDGTVPESPPEPAPTLTFFADTDADGFGDPDNSVEAESLPEGYVEDSGDCDDGDASVHPGAKDPVRDGVDQDCDGFFQWLAGETVVGASTISWIVDTAAQEATLGEGGGPSVKFDYDVFGRITRFEIPHPIAGTLFSLYAYDEQGHLVEWTRGSYDDPASPIIGQVTQYVYAGDLKVSAKRYGGDPASEPVNRSERWEYDAEGRVLLYENFSGDFEAGGTLAHSDEYAYDANGFLNGLTQRNGTGTILFASVLTNDEGGRPLTYKKFNGDPAEPSSSVTDSLILSYDGDKLTQYLDFTGDFDDPASELYRLYLMSYDPSGHRIGLRYYGISLLTPDWGLLTLVEWTYDVHGNVLSVALPHDTRDGLECGALAEISDEDPSFSEEPTVPCESMTASNYFLAPFDIVNQPGLFIPF